MSYTLVWEDLFEKDGKPNPKHWTLETGGHGFGNNEAQYYTDKLDNAYVKDGILHIVGLKENYDQNAYTSAKLTTLGTHMIKYGRVEVMAKIPQGKGTWPAIWFLGQNIKEVGWPACGEIDLMEHVGHHPEHIHFSLHAKDNHHLIGNQPTLALDVPGILEGFHEFAIEWDEEGISFFLDQNHMVTFKKKDFPHIKLWPFDQPFYLILNIALGGTWGGPIDDSIFPVHFEFKYVKVYERS
jgi:beta-glucanase (GH16 family)